MGWGGKKGGKIRKVSGRQIMVNLNDRFDILLLSLSFKCYLIPTIPMSRAKVISPIL